MDRYQLLVNDPNVTFSSHYCNANGLPYLDMYEDVSIEDEKNAIGLNELNELKDIYSVGINLPKTKRNAYIFSRYIDFYGRSNNALIPVMLIRNSNILKYDKLRVVKYSEFDDKLDDIDVDIFNSDSFLERLGKVKVTDLIGTDFVTPELLYQFNLSAGVTNIYNDWDSDYHVWQKGQIPVYFPPVRYSSNMGAMKLMDLRPFVNFYYLLEKFTCLAGYKLDAPLLRSDWFRKKWLYLLIPNFYNYANKGQNWRGDANMVTDIVINTSPMLEFPQINSNVGGQFNSLGTWVNNTSFTIMMDFEISLLIEVQTVGSLAKEWGLFVMSAPTGGFAISQSMSVMKTDIDAASPIVLFSPYIVRKSYKNIVVAPNQAVQFGVNFGGGGQWLIKYKGSPSTSIKAIANASYIYPSDVIDVATMIKEEITPLSLYKAVMHAINGKLIIDENLKIVRLLHAEGNSVNAVTNGVESYYKNPALSIDLSKETVSESLESNYQQILIDRYINFTYQRSISPLIDDFNKFLSPQSIHGQRVDLGANKGYRDSTYDYENPLFSAVLNVSDLIKNGDVSPNAVDMPVMWDNDKGVNTSFDLQPTIIHIEHGRYGQYILPPITNPTLNYKTLQLEANVLAYLPLSYQFTNIQYNSPITLGGAANQSLDTNTMLTYSKLTEIFYRNSILEKTNNVLHKIIVTGKKIYSVVSPREIVRIFSKRGFRHFKVISVKRLNKSTSELDIISADFKNNC